MAHLHFIKLISLVTLVAYTCSHAELMICKNCLDAKDQIAFRHVQLAYFPMILKILCRKSIDTVQYTCCKHLDAQDHQKEHLNQSLSEIDENCQIWLLKSGWKRVGSHALSKITIFASEHVTNPWECALVHFRRQNPLFDRNETTNLCRPCRPNAC
jgi:hypothetical protein